MLYWLILLSSSLSGFFSKVPSNANVIQLYSDKPCQVHIFNTEMLLSAKKLILNLYNTLCEQTMFLLPL